MFKSNQRDTIEFHYKNGITIKEFQGQTFDVASAIVD